MHRQNPKGKETKSSKSNQATDPAGSDASFPIKKNKSEHKAITTHQSRQQPAAPITRRDGCAPARSVGAAAEESKCCGRERLKRHCVEVSRRVWIPEIWGQEDSLKDWTDCAAFDSTLVSSSIVSARESLIEEGRRANSTRFGIENSC